VKDFNAKEVDMAGKPRRGGALLVFGPQYTNEQKIIGIRTDLRRAGASKGAVVKDYDRVFV
jgi:hypothetical protein